MFTTTLTTQMLHQVLKRTRHYVQPSSLDTMVVESSRRLPLIVPFQPSEGTVDRARVPAE